MWKWKEFHEYYRDGRNPKIFDLWSDHSWSHSQLNDDTVSVDLILQFYIFSAYSAPYHFPMDRLPVLLMSVSNLFECVPITVFWVNMISSPAIDAQYFVRISSWGLYREGPTPSLNFVSSVHRSMQRIGRQGSNALAFCSKVSFVRSPGVSFSMISYRRQGSICGLLIILIIELYSVQCPFRVW